MKDAQTWYDIFVSHRQLPIDLNEFMHRVNLLLREGCVEGWVHPGHLKVTAIPIPGAALESTWFSITDKGKQVVIARLS
jgi:hypothetical protein